jgi:hypothetical protein
VNPLSSGLAGRGLPGSVRRSRVAGRRWAATRRAARSPDREAHPRSSRPDPGPDNWRPRPKGTGAPRSAELGYSPAPSGADSLSVTAEADLTATDPAEARPAVPAAAEHVRSILDHASCDPPLRADRPRQRAFRDVPGGAISLPDSTLGAALRHRGRPPIPFDRVLPHSPWRFPTGARMAKTAGDHSERCCGIPASSARTSVSR